MNLMLTVFHLVWPPLSAFAHAPSPQRARLWWTTKILGCVLALVVLLVAMHDASKHLPYGGKASSGRHW